MTMHVNVFKKKKKIINELKVVLSKRIAALANTFEENRRYRLEIADLC